MLKHSSGTSGQGSAVIAIQNISKVYAMYKRPSDRLIEVATGRQRHHDFHALEDVTLQVNAGEMLALIGPNGSGKSTLLQIVAGIVTPTRGVVRVEGRVAALLELGAGFNPEFTGRENVLLNGEIMGRTRDEMIEAFPRIEAFAGIGEFIDRPVKEYSSGMYVRLAFSTAIHVEPDVLIVDEALAVGDAIFSRRCVEKFEELKARGVTILFVSHDLGLVKRLADRAVFLHHGQVIAEGRPSDVVNRYVGLVLEHHAPRGEDERTQQGDSTYRHGDGSSRVVEVELLDLNGRAVSVVPSGSAVTVRVRAEFVRACDQPVIGILIRNRLGLDVFGTNTRVEGRELGAVAAGQELVVEFGFDCLLAGHEYTLTAATQNWDGTSQDWIDDVLSFRVADPRGVAGVASLPVRVESRVVEAAAHKDG
ncbi:MAG: ABC transporter ATP-binding protein [Acidobacteria bacterium]|nr:ABC transporter ATP-binding protein [Acidobacteriota bacterium]